MKEQAEKLKQLIATGLEYIRQTDEENLSRKLSPEKWSKKEILGHLIDSGINNLQRFTEIQNETKPYKIRKYRQDDLVRANDYQNADIQELADFWKAVNFRIIMVILQQTDKTLAFPVDLGENEMVDLSFLIRDYIDHLEHHLKQIMMQKR
ncbi:DinB family protein [Algoriphagus sp. A40]|uniref:DinB family protein n=1 Tax=Algoriphagus sp. A40 TaxID=1945863 RepID=UPI000987797C|nr:DinB family protein [Algoriphagus sp. A40]OOG72996.1 hypothetical protein B0E43_13795 [Algoriphagus sp. A40]